jgi:Oxidoreductase family, NAD-binding Rossmann fold
MVGGGSPPRKEAMIMKVALLGTGFGQAHAAVYAQRSDVDEVVVFGRTSEKLAQTLDDFSFATSTDLDAVLNDSSVDLVDICLPTRLHAEVAVRALNASKDVLIELPLADTLDDAARIVAAQRASGRHAFVDMFSRSAGFTGQGPNSLIAFTAEGEHPFDLASTSPYAAMIDHVLACLAGHDDNLIEPGSALPALELTLNVHHQLAQTVSAG